MAKVIMVQGTTSNAGKSFDNFQVTKTIVKILAKNKGIDFEETEEFDFNKYKQEQYDILADNVRSSLDMTAIYKIIGIK